jgi:hypothetical protein
MHAQRNHSRTGAPTRETQTPQRALLRKSTGADISSKTVLAEGCGETGSAASRRFEAGSVEFWDHEDRGFEVLSERVTEKHAIVKGDGDLDERCF